MNSDNKNLNKALVPLKNLEDKPVYSGSTALVQYIEREGRKPKTIKQKVVETEPNKKLVNQEPEGRKKKPSKKKKKGFAISKGAKDKNNKIKEKKSKKEINYEELGYPKKVKLPVDVEILDGERGVFFNIEKWLEYRGLTFISKVIPIHRLDKMTYNKRIFDNMAPKLHDEAIRYNEMSAKEQYAADKRYRNKLLLMGAGAIATFALIFVMSVVPSYQSKEALSLLRSGDYQSAYASYDSISRPDKIDDYYKQYALAMGYLQAQKYEKAKEELMKLEGYSAEYVDLDNSMQEIYYQQAEAFYKEGRYADAANNLKVTYNYKDSKERFLEASYMSLDELMNADNFEEAMKMLSLLGDYKDSQEKGRVFMENLYQEAQVKYQQGAYGEAEELFFYVAQNNYKNSQTMIYQAQYNAGLEYYKDKDYDKAIEQLSKIRWFKDSSAMLSDMYYTKGKALLDTDPIRAYDNFINCIMYRDTVNILMHPSLVLYGEWIVDSFNSSSVSNVSLAFDAEHQFYSNAPESVFLENIELSNNEESHPYVFDGSSYISDSSENTIGVSAIDLNHIVLKVRHGDTIDEINLIRNKPLEKNNLDVFTSVRDSFYEYIDSKLGITSIEPTDNE